MLKKPETVIICPGRLTPDGFGDFARCTNCGTLFLDAIGREDCPKCKGRNLAWAHPEYQECDVQTLENLGYETTVESEE